MQDLDVKAIKKLAEACRKAGIKSFKGYGIEFTLSESEPTRARRSKKIQTNDQILTDSPTEEELLFWSAGGAISQVPGATAE